MSIIHDALKKADKSPKQPPLYQPADMPSQQPDQKKSPKPAPKKFLIPGVLAACLLLLFYLTTGQKNSKAHHNNHKENRRALSIVTTKTYAPNTLTLEGIIYSPTEPLAVINGKTLKPGDKINDYTLVTISATDVRVKDALGEEKDLSM